MTIQDVLNDIDALCKRCDDATDDIVLSRLSRDDAKAAHVHWRMESLIVACHQELSFLRWYIEEESTKKRCYFCGHELVWNNDFDLSDISGDEEDDTGIVSYYTCPHCGRTYEISDPCIGERENEYKSYWNHDEDTEHRGGETSQAV